MHITAVGVLTMEVIKNHRKGNTETHSFQANTWAGKDARFKLY